VGIRRWHSNTVEEPKHATVIGIFPEDDIAVLKTAEENHAYAPLFREARLNDLLVGIGFPTRDGRQEFDQFAASFEGHTQFLDASGREGIEEKFKAAQVEPGFSGGPLLNLRTLRVMGIVVATRDRSSSLGGWAIDIEVVKNLLAAIGVTIPTVSPAWLEVANLQLQQQHAERLLTQGRERSKTFAPPFQAPALPRHYVERSEVLSRVLKYLSDDGDKSSGVLLITAVHGLGGLGKSALASAVAHSPTARSRFSDGVLWATLGQEPRILPLLESWIQAISDETLATWTIESASNYLRTQLHERAMLLVVDDAWESESVQPFLVGGSQCAVLITTRRAEVSDNIGADSVALPVMTPKESLELVTKRARRSLDQLSKEERASAVKLAEDLGHHPFALELIGARISRGYTWTETRRQLLAEQATTVSDAGPRARVLHRVQASLSLSIRYLREEDTALWEAFLWLALLPPKQQITIRMARNFWFFSEQRTEFILNTLSDDALIQKTDDGFVLHDLMHEMARSTFVENAPEGFGIILSDGHARILENYRHLVKGKRWSELPDDGYIYANLAWHLQGAGQAAGVVSLLNEIDDNGRNAWYAKRDELGQTSGYLEDVKLAQQLISLHRIGGPSDHISLALNVTSIRSTTINIRPQLVSAIVHGGIWSPAKTYQWILDMRREQPEFFIQLVIGIDFCADAHQFDRIRSEALELAHQIVTAKQATAPGAGMLGRIVGLIEPKYQIEAVNRALVWCHLIENKLAFIKTLPSSLQTSYLRSIGDAALLVEDPSDKVHRIAELIRIIPPEDEGELARYFEAIFNEMNCAEPSSHEENIDLDTPENFPADTNRAWSLVGAIREWLGGGDHPKQSSASANKKSTSNPAAVPLRQDLERGSSSGTRSSNKSVHARFPFSLNHISVAELLAALPRLPPHLDTLARKAIMNAGSIWRPQLLAKLDEVQALPWHKDKPRGNRETLFRAAVNSGNFEAARDLINTNDALDQLIYSISQIEVRVRLEEFLATLAPIILSLPDDQRARFGRELLSKGAESASVFAILSSSGSGESAAAAAIARLQKIGSVPDSYTEALSCMWFGSPRVRAEAFREHLRIRDSDEQAGAVFALMPYLPKNFPREILVDFENEQIVGSQIAGLTLIVKELIAAVSAGALTEIVEAASRKHSEWWVVEALIMTLRKTRAPAELAAILRASSRIRNLDLRAKLLGRIALRSADLGYYSRSIEIDNSIELPALRWQELGELAVRIAQVGNIAQAKVAASMIASSYERSEAYMGIALELGVQGRQTDAREIIVRHVDSPKWKDRVAQMLLLFDQPANIEKTVVDERIANRHQTDARITSSAIILRGISEATQAVGSSLPFEEVRKAAEQNDTINLSLAISSLWRADYGGRTFSEMLSQLPRPNALNIVRALAPVIAFGEGETEVVNTIRAIRNVGTWWP
jgi:hypothetical protein